jgi:hypothetical protein
MGGQDSISGSFEKWIAIKRLRENILAFLFGR